MNRKELLDALVMLERELGLVEALYRTYESNFRVAIRYSKTFEQTGVEELILSVRSQNALKRAGIFTMASLIEAIEQEKLGSIRNLGKKSKNEIKTTLLVYMFNQLNDREKKAFFEELIERNPDRARFRRLGECDS